MTRIGPDASYARDVLPSVVVLGLGMALTVVPLTATALSSAPAHRVGVASAINNDVARIGGLLAVAVLPALAGITPAAFDHAEQLSTGFHHAMLICAVIYAAGGLLSGAFLRNAQPVGTPATPPAALVTPAATAPLPAGPCARTDP